MYVHFKGYEGFTFRLVISLRAVVCFNQQQLKSTAWDCNTFRDHQNTLPKFQLSLPHKHKRFCQRISMTRKGPTGLHACWDILRTLLALFNQFLLALFFVCRISAAPSTHFLAAAGSGGPCAGAWAGAWWGAGSTPSASRSPCGPIRGEHEVSANESRAHL